MVTESARACSHDSVSRYRTASFHVLVVPILTVTVLAVPVLAVPVLMNSIFPRDCLPALRAIRGVFCSGPSSGDMKTAYSVCELMTTDLHVRALLKRNSDHLLRSVCSAICSIIVEHFQEQ